MVKRTRREELLDMFDQRSSDKRCDIVLTLRREGKVVTADLDAQVREIGKLKEEAADDIAKLRDKMAGLDQEIYDVNGKKANLLKEHNLYSFKKETCGTDKIHADLIAFDDEVRKERQDLLMMKLPR